MYIKIPQLQPWMDMYQVEKQLITFEGMVGPFVFSSGLVESAKCMDPEKVYKNPTFHANQNSSFHLLSPGSN
jgi:hypothetical protein